MRPIQFFGLISTSALLSACGGGASDETATTDPANGFAPTSQQEQIEDTASAAIANVKTVLLEDQLAPNIPLPTYLIPNFGNSAAASMSSLGTDDPGTTVLGGTPVTETVTGTCGGEATLTTLITSPDGQIASTPLTVGLTGEFDMFCNDNPQTTDLVTLDGILDFLIHLNDNTSGYVSIEYDLNIAAVSEDVDYSGHYVYSEYCTFEDNFRSCTENSSTVSNLGDEYTLSDVVVSGDELAGYNATGLLSSDNGSAFDINFSDVLFCSNGNFQNGNFQITDNDSQDVISISFNNCEEAVISFQGNSWVISQP